MGVEVTGLREVVKAFKTFQPDIQKNLNKEVRAFAAPVVNKAKGFLEASPSGLSNWAVQGSAKKFKESQPEQRKGFPKFNASLAKRGIYLRTKPTKPNRQGFVSIFSIVNTDPAGAIYETAGRKNPSGQPWAGRKKSGNHKYSHSLNPRAGEHFIKSLGSLEGSGMMRGRVIFKAWNENKGKAQGKILLAVDKTIKDFQKVVNK